MDPDFVGDLVERGIEIYTDRLDKLKELLTCDQGVYRSDVSAIRCVSARSFSSIQVSKFV